MKRRAFLQSSVGAGVLAASGRYGAPTSAWALPVTEPFDARNEAEVLRALFGDLVAMPSDAVRLEAPLLATRGMGVPVKIRFDGGHADTIAVVTANNRRPLSSYLTLKGAAAYYATRIKVEQTSAVTAYVQAGGKLYAGSIRIKVTAGGYGTTVDPPYSARRA